ncbi:MAG TPA: NosD domain-containing protein [Terriglobales bacterium]
MKRVVIQTLRIRAISVIILAAFYGTSSYGLTRVVGPSACRAALPHFSTIQGAVNASGPGDVVLVCPGNYPEQVVINTPLTLKGIVDENAGVAVITVPSGGLVPNGQAPDLDNTPYGGTTAVQLLMQNVPQIVVSDITIDGTGGSSNAGLAVGIELYNIGQSGTATAVGNINHVVVRNTGSGVGILSDNSYAIIQNNSVYGNTNAAFVASGRVKVLSNNIAVSGSSSFATYLYVASGLISNNRLTGGNVGMYLEFTESLTIASNIVEHTEGAAIYLRESSQNFIKQNVIADSNLGIGMVANPVDCCAATANDIGGNRISGVQTGVGWSYATYNTIHNNVFTTTQTAVSMLDSIIFNTGGNTVKNNVVNDSTCGIAGTGTANGTVYTPNTFFSTSTPLCP